MNKFSVLLFSVFIASACASRNPLGSVAPNDGNSDSEGAALTTAGQLTVSGIPEKYLDGVILVSGINRKGETFTYSPKVFQKITGSAMAVKLYSKAAMVQEPFDGNGEYTVTVSLYAKDDNTETRIFVRRFINGGAVLDWNDIPR
jgi:hypothetical protein